MSTDRVREAARLIRERAKAASPGLWFTHEEHGRDYSDESWSEVGVARHPFANSQASETVALTCAMGWDGPDEASGNAAYIASMHPTVALAVADMFDAFATDWEISGADPSPIHPVVRVAEAYLGATP